MKTAVQLRPIAARDLPRCDLLWGAPVRTVAGELGPIALFGSGAIVAYRLRRLRRRRLYVFRTLHVDDRLAADVPGVRPRVQLLLSLNSASRVRLAQKLFSYLVNTRRDPSSIPDDFYLRVGVALGGRLPPRKIMLSLLHPECRHEPSPSLPYPLRSHA
jgi:hypothetical protein